MYENMLFWHQEAVRLGTRLNEFVTDYERSLAGGGAQLLDVDGLQRIREMLGHFLRARDMSEKCATDAAPYIHPKLAAITVEKDVQRRIRIIGGLPPKPLPAPDPPPAPPATTDG